MSMKTLLMIAFAAVAFADVAAITPTGATDFSGVWIGEGKSNGPGGTLPCWLNFTITHTPAAYSEERRITCGDIIEPFPGFTATISGRDLLKDGDVVGTITDTEVRSKVSYGDLDIHLNAILANGTLNVMVFAKVPNAPDVMGVIEAVLKRSTPAAPDKTDQAPQQ